MLLSGALAGTKIAGVIGIHAIGEVCESELDAQRFHADEELILAVKAAIGVVALILRAVQLLGGNDVQGDLLRESKVPGLMQIAPGKAGRIGQHGEHFVAQNAMGRGSQKCRINAAGIGNHEPFQRAQLAFKGEQL